MISTGRPAEAQCPAAIPDDGERESGAVVAERRASADTPAANFDGVGRGPVDTAAAATTAATTVATTVNYRGDDPVRCAIEDAAHKCDRCGEIGHRQRHCEADKPPKPLYMDAEELAAVALSLQCGTGRYFSKFQTLSRLKRHNGHQSIQTNWYTDESRLKCSQE